MGEKGSGGRDVEEGEAVVARVLHLPDALLEGDGELHRGGGGRWFGFDWAGKVRGVAVRTGTNAQDQRVSRVLDHEQLGPPTAFWDLG